jgi:hypothetical protein
MKGLPDLYSGVSIATLVARASLSGEGGEGFYIARSGNKFVIPGGNPACPIRNICKEASF